MTDPAHDQKDHRFEGPCPRCGGGVPNDTHKGEYPGALSRLDNETYICSDCGTNEAFNGGHFVPFDIPLVSDEGAAFRRGYRAAVDAFQNAQVDA